MKEKNKQKKCESGNKTISHKLNHMNEDKKEISTRVQKCAQMQQRNNLVG